jgi:hypothetical protein
MDWSEPPSTDTYIMNTFTILILKREESMNDCFIIDYCYWRAVFVSNLLTGQPTDQLTNKQNI